jgi:hypothetical protein
MTAPPKLREMPQVVEARFLNEKSIRATTRLIGPKERVMMNDF